jgi:GNAT superfamily N-acetyltransferase
MSGLDDEDHRIVPLEKVHLDEAVRLYQRVWHDENAYAEVFREEEALDAIGNFKHPWVIKSDGKVTGLVGGMPLPEYVDHLILKFNKHENGHVREALDELAASHDKCYYIDTVAIAAVHQGKGLGTRLFKLIIDDRSHDGFTSFLLRTALHHENPACRLYRKFNFKPLLDSRGMPVVELAEQERHDHRPPKDCRAYLLMEQPFYHTGL